ncbi:MAG: polyribonucleotide nucleotidyltransferase, partial [Deltaproteobacteria bacterium]|nr:polyribonucleotide nucleotidyltransferase [Deltaproteobacteria bacterium]
MVRRYETEYGGRTLYVEMGKMAKQAHGSVTLRYGDTVVLVTACRADSPSPGVDFMPLTCNYVEMTYAAGKIPGGFFKREGRASEKEVLTSRLIDRPIRPLFPEGYRHETQVIATVMSLDPACEPDVVAMVGASIALTISDIPFNGPMAAVRMGEADGKIICNPTTKQQKEGGLDMVVAGCEGSIIMVEGGAQYKSEEFLLEALSVALDNIKAIVDLQRRIAADFAPVKLPLAPVEHDSALMERVRAFAGARLKDALKIPVKQDRYSTLSSLKKETVASLAPDFAGREKEIEAAYGDLKYDFMREMVIKDGKRVDGRGPKDIRAITCEVGLLPRTHGSALFTRGETQAMVVTTLGTSEDEQKIDALAGWEYKNFMLHYNFPPFSVGEVKFLRGPGRREIGHGALAERAVTRTLPKDGGFPYTIRVVSDVLESNGSSSMATVCGASLSLMDAGVPVKNHVAGIAMGLIKEGDKTVVLSDILGDEDHLGDMDFKVAGSEGGVTALQMDIKIQGVTPEILKEALHQAKDGRLHILGKMRSAIEAPRADLSAYAPRITTIYVKQEKIKDVIGPGGKNIKGI